MRGRAERSRPHRLSHQEQAAFQPVQVNLLEKGDVFVRCGTPHIVVDPPVEVWPMAERTGQLVWITNLLSGGCWTIAGNEMVHPAYDVKLTFSSGRRET